MIDKFTISLVWHNCETHPPKEDWNECLFVSDGKYVVPVLYNSQHGWFNRSINSYIPQHELRRYWWADLERTVRNSIEFTEVQTND